MGFPHHNSHAQPTGSSSRQANAQQIQNVISQSHKSFARLLQQEETNAQAKENPWGSKNQNTDKGKGATLVLKIKCIIIQKQAAVEHKQHKPEDPNIPKQDHLHQ
ncbi:hypothetical protein O181_062178 [Austropuccinia psidii MF-1]|uniref:Uncharacterized protein n=1 Tax=Austropuccinia psidii MF-1 TaxID=1389203 RepID=A0A9Q3EP90_9BASI|nr:hypothetical protein [Austropuccinia psidii MF-1]